MILSSEKILQLVNNCLEQMPYNREPKSLYEPIQYVLSMGGKRIRPVLMLLSYNLFRDNPESILMPACALETYHNYTLLHDDLMDHADAAMRPFTRNGMPTRPFSRATRCWCWPTSAWHNATPPN